MKNVRNAVLWIFCPRLPPDGGSMSDAERDGDKREDVAELVYFLIPLKWRRINWVWLCELCITQAQH